MKSVCLLCGESLPSRVYLSSQESSKSSLNEIDSVDSSESSISGSSTLMFNLVAVYNGSKEGGCSGRRDDAHSDGMLEDSVVSLGVLPKSVRIDLLFSIVDFG